MILRAVAQSPDTEQSCEPNGIITDKQTSDGLPFDTRLIRIWRADAGCQHPISAPEPGRANIMIESKSVPTAIILARP